MEERSIDELGPVDYLIVEFQLGAQNFTGEGADELIRLHDAGIIRIMDILILAKDEDGSVEAMELSDLPRARRAPAARGPARADAGRRRRRAPRRGHGAGQRPRLSSSTRPGGRPRSPRRPAGPVGSSSPTAASPPRPLPPPSRPMRPKTEGD